MSQLATCLRTKRTYQEKNNCQPAMADNFFCPHCPRRGAGQPPMSFTAIRNHVRLVHRCLCVEFDQLDGRFLSEHITVAVAKPASDTSTKVGSQLPKKGPGKAFEAVKKRPLKETAEDGSGKRPKVDKHAARGRTDSVSFADFRCSPCNFQTSEAEDMMRHLSDAHHGPKLERVEFDGENPVVQALEEGTAAAENEGNLDRHVATRAHSKREEEKLIVGGAVEEIRVSVNPADYLRNDDTAANNTLSDNPEQDVLCDSDSDGESNDSEVVEVAQPSELAEVTKPPGELNCDKCDFKTRGSWRLKRHRDSVHLNLKPFKCPHCESDFKDKRALVQHRHRRHNDDEHSRGAFDLAPTAASELTPQSTSNLALPRTDSKATTDYLTATVSSSRMSSKDLRCSDCRDSFPTLFKLKRHAKKAHGMGEVRFCCADCGRSVDDMEKHACRFQPASENHEQVIHEVDDCEAPKDAASSAAPSESKALVQNSKESTNSSSSNCQVRPRHGQDKRHSCTLCDYAASRPNRLRLHLLKAHDKVDEIPEGNDPTLYRRTMKNHICPQCKYIADSPKRLRVHLAKAHNELDHLPEGRDSSSDFSAGPDPPVHPSTYKKVLVTNGEQSPAWPGGDKKHQCRLCDFLTNRPVKLRVHLAKAHEILEGIGPMKNRACSLCSYIADRASRLRVHLVNVHKKLDELPEDSGKTHHCEACNYSTDRASRVQAHVEREHAGDQRLADETYEKGHPKVLKCPNCPYGTPDLGLFRAHISSEHGSLQTATSTKSMRCGQCDFAAPDSRALKRHLKQVHSAQNTNEDTVTTELATTKRNEVSKKIDHIIPDEIKSPERDKTQTKNTPVPDASDFKNGQVTRSKKAGLQCPYCSTKIHDRFNLKRHIRTQHNAQEVAIYFCKRCDFVAVIKEIFEEHCQSAHGNGHQGGKKRRQDAHQLDHIKKVEGEIRQEVLDEVEVVADDRKVTAGAQEDISKIVSTSFRCNLCSYTGKSRPNLKNHLTKMHNRPKVSCDRCGYSTVDSSNLLRHTKAVHDNIRDQVCSQCDYATVSTGELNRHIKITHRTGV